MSAWSGGFSLGNCLMGGTRRSLPGAAPVQKLDLKKQDCFSQLVKYVQVHKVRTFVSCNVYFAMMFIKFRIQLYCMLYRKTTLCAVLENRGTHTEVHRRN